MRDRGQKFTSNVVNPDAVDAVVADHRDRTRPEAGKLWWSRNFRNHVLRSPSLLVPVRDENQLMALYQDGVLHPPVQRWAVRDLKARRPVHRA